MAKLRQIIENIIAPPKPSTPTAPTKPKPKPNVLPWNPPRPKENPVPKAGTTKTPTKPSTPTMPTKPKPKPNILPWNPPRPKENPIPKARTKAFFLTEAYEDEVNPATRRFWGGIRRGQHTFTKHPILAMYGEESAKKAFADNVERLAKAFPEFNNMPTRQRLQNVYQRSIQLFSQVMQIESRYKTQLEQIAKEVVSEVYGIPDEAMIASLSTNPRANFDMDEVAKPKKKKPQKMDFEEDEPKEQEEQEERADLHDQINKRITLNILTQGAAVHNMMTIYNLATEKINALNPRLLQMYKELSPGMLSSYWLQDFIAIADMLQNSIAGSAMVVYSDDEGEEEEEEDYSSLFDDEDEYGADDSSEKQTEYSGPKIRAIAMCFPILIQELVKGAMELLSHHGLADLDEVSTSRVLKTADVLTDEPWLIQVGPHIWRSFLKIVPKGSDLAMVVAKLARQDPKFIHDLLSQTIEELHQGRDPANQRQILQDMIDEIEDYAGEDIDDIL